MHALSFCVLILHVFRLLVNFDPDCGALFSFSAIRRRLRSSDYFHHIMAAAQGLFDEQDDVKAAAPESIAARRTKLFPWDSVASQLFEPHGESALDGMSLEQVWSAACKGNKKAAYHSHLCASQATDAWHVGAGISLTAASLLAAIKYFRQDDMKKLIAPGPYAKVEEELKTLEPTLVLLNLGKGSQHSKDTGSFRAAKRQKATASGTDGMTGTEQETLDAARAFHRWLSSPKSAFRSVLFLLSGSNTFYSGHCADVVARASLQHKPITEDQFAEAMRARTQKMPQPVPSSKGTGSDTTGLFDL